MSDGGDERSLHVNDVMKLKTLGSTKRKRKKDSCAVIKRRKVTIKYSRYKDLTSPQKTKLSEHSRIQCHGSLIGGEI